MISLSRAKALYQAAILEGSFDRARRVVDQAKAAGASTSDVYLSIVEAAQKDIGNLWQAGQVSVAEEHRATEVSLNILHYLRSAEPRGKSLDARAVIAVIEEDFHSFGARVVADFLTFDGWVVEFLGASVPADEIVDFANSFQPHLVGISLARSVGKERARHVIEQLKTFSQRPFVLVGGPAIDAKAVKYLGADGYAEDAKGAVSLARRLVDVAGSSNGSPRFLSRLGKRIQSARKAKGISQAEFASIAGLDRSYVSAIENGRHNLSVRILVNISSTLGVPVSDLIHQERGDNGN